MKDETFIFNNWKKSDKLKEHAKSNVHKNAMAKWIGSKINAKHKTSVIKQLTDAHQQDVRRNREYLRVIITSIFYNTQQNVGFRGHEENRDDIGKMSEKNRGNLLELLNLRCNDIPWLKDKLKSQLKLHAQWTSPSIQNEILEIISHFVVQRITKDVQLSRNYALIMDETSDTSCTEQVSICLRHVLHSITLETFLGFFSTISTEGEVLFKLVKKVMTDHGLELDDIVGECKMFEDGLSDLLPILYEVATILASIPATSSSAERSFSSLRRVKTYLRSTMGQQRLNSIALINIEQAYANQTIANDMIEIIDTFGEPRGRDKYFF